VAVKTLQLVIEKAGSSPLRVPRVIDNFITRSNIADCSTMRQRFIKQYLLIYTLVGRMEDYLRGDPG
jgi:hypothetical protein